MRITEQDKTFHPLKFLILICLLVVSCAALIYLIRVRTVKCAYFNISRIVMRGGADIAPPSYLLGKNLFSVDLEKIEKRLFFDYPKLYRVDILRSLPDALVINAEERLPVAKIKLQLATPAKKRGQNKIYFVDEEAVILEMSLIEKYEKLPEIIGLAGKIKNFYIGQRLRNDDLKVALNILKAYNVTDNLRVYPIEYIDITDSSGAFFEIMASPFSPSKASTARASRNKLRVKVIIGRDETKKRIKILSSLLPKIRSNLKKVKYIDLRFQDPVTGTR